jgi:hypothetical protein
MIGTIDKHKMSKHLPVIELIAKPRTRPTRRSSGAAGSGRFWQPESATMLSRSIGAARLNGNPFGGNLYPKRLINKFNQSSGIKR